MRIFSNSSLGLALSLAPLAAQESVIIDELPGYYEFFMKTGDQQQIRAEVRRNARIEAGELRPVTVDTAMPDFVLPLSTGGDLRFSDYKGKKNLMVVSFRSWW
jgi:hypothetical protein